MLVFEVKSEFPFFSLPNHPVYLDSAATTQKPRVLIDAYSRLLCQGVANVHRSAYRLANQWTDAFEQARQTVADFLGANASSMVWTRGTTESINLVARCFVEPMLKPGDRIAVSLLEHHANLVPWQQVCQRTGAELVFLPLNVEHQLDVSKLDEFFSTPVRFVAVTAMSNALGIVNDIPAIVAAAHRHQAKVLVDAAQYVAHQPIHVRAWDCDFLAFSAHKLYGPTGLGVLYGKPQLLASMLPWLTGGEMVTSVQQFSAEFQQAPLKFEAGTPAFIEAVAFAEVLRWLGTLDRQAFHAQEQKLLQMLDKGLDDIRHVHRLIKVGERAAISSFVVEAWHASDVASLLNERNIALRAGQLCAMPLLARLQQPALLRVSLGLYSDENDINALLNTLNDLSASTKSTAQVNDNPISLMQQARSWEQKNRVLMQLGKQWSLPVPVPHHDSNQVQGCDSSTWLVGQYQQQQWTFAIDSEARIIRGIGALLSTLVNDKSSQQILAMDLAAELNQLGLTAHLSASRNNGVRAIIERIRQQVAAEVS
ncbi:aminotransferase class V-fold PLP-dependent enzyme [Permianibacter aggregans]|uniref:cysteine desulfurase n=1 Tax=Permianibacter aggregans TaxID=1510150 RepID=A0A4R6UV90_9GAMM|nr:aminotransferase class V-fold PLP-dependent enzyme [Permianibacter aggregans]TDQ51250.1 cysteine desulfurase [Permianibacter aggregans]